MNLLTEQLKSEIDNLLSELTEFNSCGLTVSTPDIRRKAIEFSKALNLIRNKQNSKSYELDEKGVFVLDDGGINAYLKNIRTEKDLDSTIRYLTSKRLKYDILYNILYVVIGGLIGLVTALSLPNTSRESIDELQRLESENIKRNEYFQKEQNIMRIQIFELNQKIDSLKVII